MAASLYHQKYGKRWGTREVANVAQNMTVVYSVIGAPGTPRQSALAQHQPKKAPRPPDMLQVADALEDAAREDDPSRIDELHNLATLLAKKLTDGLEDGGIKPKASDFAGLVRTLALLKQLQADEHMFKGAGVSENETIQLSQRVTEARKVGGSELEAMLEDAHELVLILTTMQTHEQQAAVFSFPGAAEVNDR